MKIAMAVKSKKLVVAVVNDENSKSRFKWWK